MEVERVTGAAAAVERMGDLLRSDEARHNLALGILSAARATPALYPVIDGWIVWDGATAVGGAIRTPPHNLVLLRPVAERAIGTLVAAIDDELTGVVGAVPEVDAFAAAWAALRTLEVRTAFDQRIYALRKVAPPEPVPGAMRLADTADRSLVVDWARAFARETLHGNDDAARVERSVDARLEVSGAGFGLWEVDGLPVSLAGFGGRTPSGIRVGPVYTPPEHRRHGYGTAVTAAVSQLNLDRGRRVCFLYTDLANQTSNAIYQRIGYEPVCDSRELAFERR